MYSIIEFFKTLFGIDANQRKSAQYFYECEKAYQESQKEQLKETNNTKDK